MPYAFQRGESISAAVPRIVAEQIDRAQEQLADASEKPAERVHNARKRFKEIRAALRMARGALDGQFTVENRWFRDAARELAAARDAVAVVEAVEKLLAHARDRRIKRVLNKARKSLRGRIPDDGSLPEKIASTLSQLPVAKARITEWPPFDHRFRSIGRGMEKTYRDGRSAFALASARHDPEHFHEWRKRVKDLWYHIRLLRDQRPEVMSAHDKELESLSDALGDHHDLVVLRQIIRNEPESFGSEEEVRTLMGVVERRMKRLEKEAVRLGHLVYSESPRTWRDRMRFYWKAWHGGAA